MTQDKLFYLDVPRIYFCSSAGSVISIKNSKLSLKSTKHI